MKTKTKRPRPEPAEEDSGFLLGTVVLSAMLLLAAGAIGWGCHRHGLVWRNVFAATSCFVTAAAFAFIGLFELEWLERIVGFVDGIVTGVTQLLWTSWFGTLSESEFVGRHRARVYWVVFGIIAFVVGCFLALGIL
jgi:hypothetical protein